MRATRRPLLFFSLIAAVLAAVTVGVWASRVRLPAQRLQLADGSVVALEAVTYGKPYRVVLGSVWMKLLLRVLPREIQSRFNDRNGYQITQITVASPAPNALTFWFRRQQ